MQLIIQVVQSFESGRQYTVDNKVVHSFESGRQYTVDNKSVSKFVKRKTNYQNGANMIRGKCEET